jgi:hypothetical protein
MASKSSQNTSAQGCPVNILDDYGLVARLQKVKEIEFVNISCNKSISNK